MASLDLQEKQDLPVLLAPWVHPEAEDLREVRVLPVPPEGVEPPATPA